MIDVGGPLSRVPGSTRSRGGIARRPWAPPAPRSAPDHLTTPSPSQALGDKITGVNEGLESFIGALGFPTARTMRNEGPGGQAMRWGGLVGIGKAAQGAKGLSSLFSKLAVKADPVVDDALDIMAKGWADDAAEAAAHTPWQPPPEPPSQLAAAKKLLDDLGQQATEATQGGAAKALSVEEIQSKISGQPVDELTQAIQAKKDATWAARPAQVLEDVPVSRGGAVARERAVPGMPSQVSPLAEPLEQLMAKVSQPLDADVIKAAETWVRGSTKPLRQVSAGQPEAQAQDLFQQMGNAGLLNWASTTPVGHMLRGQVVKPHAGGATIGSGQWPSHLPGAMDLMRLFEQGRPGNSFFIPPSSFSTALDTAQGFAGITPQMVTEPGRFNPAKDAMRGMIFDAPGPNVGANISDIGKSVGFNEAEILSGGLFRILDMEQGIAKGAGQFEGKLPIKNYVRFLLEQLEAPHNFPRRLFSGPGTPTARPGGIG